jgi:hypothetical protein
VTTRQANSTLADLPLETEYRSDCHDLVRDFYLPCLQRSTQYGRAVGYFTSRGLSVAAQGITALIHGGGRRRLVARTWFGADKVRWKRH